MKIVNPTMQEKILLDFIGKPLGTVRWNPQIDWHGYFPVVDADAVIVGLFPEVGFEGIEFEIDKLNNVVWADDIISHRPIPVPYFTK